MDDQSGLRQSSHRDAVAAPATVRVASAVPTAAVVLRTHLFYQWARIAFSHARAARQAQDDAIAALFGAISDLIPNSTSSNAALKHRQSRAGRIHQTFHRSFHLGDNRDSA